MRKQRFFPIPLGIRIAPDTRDWLEKKAISMRMSASALARQFIEEQARRDLVKGEVDGDLQAHVGD